MEAVPPDQRVVRPARNWAFMLGLGICSIAVAGLGVFGWAHSSAPVALIVCAAAFCVAAQFVAACCGANFGRHTWRAAWMTRLWLLAGYLIAASFAAYSADQGWMVATSEPYVREVAERANERGRIEAEIAEREGYVRVAEGQRATVRAPGPVLTAQLQAPYTETIQRNEARLTELRNDLESKPALPLERERGLFDWAALLAFVLWQALEPWLYGAAERGRRPTALQPPSAAPQPRQPFEVVEGGLSTGRSTTQAAARPLVQPRRSRGWLGLRTLASFALGWWATGAPQPALPPPSTGPTMPANDPAERAVERAAAPIRVDQLPVIANQMSAARIGERRIAERLSERYGEKISRYQVRIWLGRETTAAA